MDENAYFGRPGNLRRMYWPDGGWDGTRTRATAVFVAGTGNTRVSKLINATRTYTLSYKGMGRDNFMYLDAFNQGHMGPGPFVFLDPAARNMLTANQSSATSMTNDTREFLLSGTGGTMSSDFSAAIPGNCPRTLKWLFSASTPGTSVLSLPGPTADWMGLPVYPRPYTFWFIAQGGGTDGIVQLTPTLTWYNAAGSSLGTSTGTATNTLNGLPLEMFVTATPPAGAAFVLCSVAATSASIAAGDFVNLWSLQLNEGAVADPYWSPGVGILPVQILSHRDVTPYMAPEFKKSNTLVLQEVRV